MEDLQKRFNHLIQYIGAYENQLILLSTTSIYSESSGEISEENNLRKNLIDPYYSIENQLKEKYNQLVILRLGGLMGDDRYLSKYLNFDTPNLNQVVNHIHYKDVCQIIEKIITTNKNNAIYNVVASEHPTKEEVLEYQLNQKIIPSKNSIGKVISSQKIQTEFNYEFLYPNPIYFNE